MSEDQKAAKERRVFIDKVGNLRKADRLLAFYQLLYEWWTLGPIPEEDSLVVKDCIDRMAADLRWRRRLDRKTVDTD